MMASLKFELHIEGTNVLLDITAGKEPVIYGLWTFEVQLDGKTLQPAGAWTEVCRHREKQCDYQEIDLPLKHGYRLQRSVLLDHKDKVLLLADAVVGKTVPRGVVTYCSSLNVSQKLSPAQCPAALTDGTCSVVRFKPVFRLMPLTGQISVADANITFSSSSNEHCFPLFFDMNPDRQQKKILYRKLTVGENLRKVDENQAVGYRVQISKEQFLMYRSLSGKSANRTVLGHNLTDDFCFARFSPKDGVEPLIAIYIPGS